MLVECGVGGVVKDKGGRLGGGELMKLMMEELW